MPIAAEWRLASGLVAGIGVALVLRTSQIRAITSEGGPILDVARHVRDGDGLVTMLSTDRAATFPVSAPVDPLWPWLLGMAAHGFDLVALAHGVPLVLALGALVAAYALGRRLWPEPLFPDEVPGLHGGHLFAIWLGLQGGFVLASGLPYPDALGWVVVLSLALRVAAKGADLGWPWAAELAIGLVVAGLARHELAVAVVAMAASYGVRALTGPRRGRVVVHGLVVVGGAAAVLLAAGVGVPERVGDGILVEWDPAGPRGSYAETFHTLHWAVVVAAPLLVLEVGAAVRREGLAALVGRLGRPEAVRWLFLVPLAAGGLWIGGPLALPAFAGSVVWLVRQPRPIGRALGVVVLGSTLVIGGDRLWVHAIEPPADLKREEPDQPLAAWLNRHRDPDGNLVVAIDPEALHLAWRTRNVGYYVVGDDVPYEDFLTLTDVRGARYVVLRGKGVDQWPFLAEPRRLARDFVTVPDAPSGHLVYERRR